MIKKILATIAIAATLLMQAGVVQAQLVVPSGGTGKSTFTQGWIYSPGGSTALTSSTSPTFNYITVTGNSTSTFANGINMTGGCFAFNGACISGGGGGAVSTVTNVDGTLTISPNSGAVIASLALAHANFWTALQQMLNASTTLLSVYGPAYFGGTATSSFSKAGALTLVTPLLSGSGGTGLNAVGASSSVLTTDGAVNVYQKLSPGNFTTPNISQWTNDSGYTTNTGTVTSVTLATPNSTLSLGGTNPVTGVGTINADLNLAHGNAWTALQQFNLGASTTVLSVYGPLYVGGSSTTTIQGNGATSTFSGGVQASYLNLTGNTAATNTAASGFNLTAGCFAIANTCITGGGGSGSGTVNAGVAGQLAVYNSSGTAVSGTSTGVITIGSLIASSTATSTFGGGISASQVCLSGSPTTCLGTSSGGGSGSLTIYAPLASTSATNGSYPLATTTTINAGESINIWMGCTKPNAGGNSMFHIDANNGQGTSTIGYGETQVTGGVNSNMSMVIFGTYQATTTNPVKLSWTDNAAPDNISDASVCGGASFFQFTIQRFVPGTVTGGGGGGSGSWPFTTTDTNYGVAVQSTTTPEWFKNGLFASTTSNFVYASTTAITAQSANILRLDNLTSAGFIKSSSIGTLSVDTSTYLTAPVANASLANSTISGVALGGTLAALTATNGSLTFSGSYTGTSAQTVGLNVGNANIWTALQSFQKGASTTVESVLGPIYIGNTASTSIVGDTGTSTFSSHISAANASTTATSTMAGINLPYGGCVAIAGVCLGSGSGSGTVNAGILGQLAFYAANGTTVSGSSTDQVTVGVIHATSTSGTSNFMGNFGIGTGTPMTGFAVGSSISTTTIAGDLTIGAVAASSTLYADKTGHLFTGGTQPVCSSGCATAPNIWGDDNTFRVLLGSSITSATVTFANSWMNSRSQPVSPSCSPTDESGVTTGIEASSTPTTVVLSLPTALTGKYVTVQCRASDNMTF